MRSHARRFELAAISIILLLAAYLRLTNLPGNPAWYTDEGTHLDIARHLLGGQTQYLAVHQSTLLFSRVPVFEALLAVTLHFTGVSMAALRWLTAALGIITVGVLFTVMRRYNRWLALIAALMLAIYPPAILYSRFGFSYNLLTPLILITVLGVCEYAHSRSKRWLTIAAFSIGFGTMSDLWMFVMIVPLMMVVIVCGWRDVVWALPLACLPFGLYALAMLMTAPQAFMFDLRFVVSRLNQLPLAQQISTLTQNFTTLSAQDSWFALGVIGLFILPTPHLRWSSLLFFLLPIILLGRTTALFSLSYYYMIPLLPFVALGMASLIRYGAPIVFRVTRSLTGRETKSGSVTLALAVVILVPFAASTAWTIDQMNRRFKTDIGPFLIDPDDARQAAGYVNQHTQHGDLVIASPGVAWLIEANVADFQMSIAYHGHATPHLPADLPHDRFAFDPDYGHARFVVVDNLWHNWAVPNVSGVAEMLNQIATWPLRFKSGEITVYENPR